MLSAKIAKLKIANTLDPILLRASEERYLIK
jgi:hypothetical protein